MRGLQPTKSIDIQWNQGHRLAGPGGQKLDLDMLAIGEREGDAAIASGVRLRQRVPARTGGQLRWSIGYHDDAGVVVGHPDDGSGGLIEGWVDREIATSSADGSRPSAWGCRHLSPTIRRNRGYRLRFVEATPTQGPRRSCVRRVRSVQRNAIEKHPASSRFSPGLRRLREGDDSFL